MYFTPAWGGLVQFIKLSKIFRSNFQYTFWVYNIVTFLSFKNVLIWVWFVSVKLFLSFTLLSCHCSHLTDTTITRLSDTTIRCSAHNLFVSTALFIKSLEPRSSNTQPQYKTDWLQLTHWSLYLAFLWSNIFSLTNVLVMEGTCSRLLEKSTATVCICSFSYMSFLHAYCCWFRCSIAVRLCCICVIHLSHSHTDVIVVLLINSYIVRTYICVSVAFVLFFS